MNAVGVAATAGSIIFAFMPAAASAQDLELNLVCDGTAVFYVEEDVNGTLGNVTDDVTKRKETSGRVRIRLLAGKGEMKLPANFPGGGANWRPLSDLSVTDDRIQGRFAVSMFSRGRLTIDRRTGDLDMTGGFDFSGPCQKDTGTEERKF